MKVDNPVDYFYQVVCERCEQGKYTTDFAIAGERTYASKIMGQLFKKLRDEFSQNKWNIIIEYNGPDAMGRHPYKVSLYLPRKVIKNECCDD